MVLIMVMLKFTLQSVTLFPHNNRINSIQRNPEYISVTMMNGYDNLERTEILHGKVLSACTNIIGPNNGYCSPLIITPVRIYFHLCTYGRKFHDKGYNSYYQ